MWTANISSSLFGPCVHNFAQHCFTVPTVLTPEISKFCPQNAFMRCVWHYGPIVLAAQSKAWVYGRSLARTAGSNTVGGHGCLSRVSVVCCQVDRGLCTMLITRPEESYRVWRD